MSSHREAPGISKDPVADNTDLYAFVSPDKPDTVTIIANYIPLEGPAGGPNFYEFGDDVLYEIHIDNNGDALPDITYQFRFTTQVRNPNTFLYNTGQIKSLDSPSWNRPQFYSVTKVASGQSTVLASGLPCPPCNVGPRSIPNYTPLEHSAVQSLPTGETVFAGQRAEEFYVDLGAVFDLAVLRPFENLHLIPTAATEGVNASNHLNVHSIAIQVPKSQLTRDGSNPTDPASPVSVIGVFASASRQTATMLSPGGVFMGAGPFVQVSRLGNPLFNEVIVPMSEKDLWNSVLPSADSQFLDDVQHPELAKLLPVLYPGVFPNLAMYTKARADLAAILLTGIPSGIIPGFQNFTGPTAADLLRLNMAILPAPTSKLSIFGILGGDLAGFPNGRRVNDDTVAIELRAVAGVTIPLVDPTFTPDAAASLLTSFRTDPPPIGSGPLHNFPYLGTPYDGFDNPPA